jgi:hypothetical protein
MDVVQRYLMLGLRLGRHVDGFVDAYYGPADLAEQVEAEAVVPPRALAEDAAELAHALEFDDEHRNEWLRAQLRGCEATARRLAGEPIDWATEVELCYGIKPGPVPEDRFEQAHAELDAALPGEGDLRGRYRAWVERQELPPEKLLPAFRLFERELRSRTVELVGLPDDEHVEIEVVHDEPWGAFNYYLGGRRSRIAVNTDLPVHSFAVPELAAHEIYPGHHTERVWKETLLVEGEGRLEESIFLTGTPQSLVSEGIAMIGPELALGEDADALAADLYRTLDVDYEPDIASAVRAFRNALEGLSVNAGHLLHVEGRPQPEVHAYVERWSLATPERAAKSVEFLTHPTWCAYASCYSAGHDLCSAFVGGDVARFRTLLTEPMTTTDLRPA